MLGGLPGAFSVMRGWGRRQCWRGCPVPSDAGLGKEAVLEGLPWRHKHGVPVHRPRLRSVLLPARAWATT